MNTARLYRRLQAALSDLRVFETMWDDLAYDETDNRRAIPDAEMPADLVATRSQLEREVVFRAAIAAGEDHDIAKLYADTPHSQAHIYNVTSVRFAATLMKWSI